jgi:hypothetical protein
MSRFKKKTAGIGGGSGLSLNGLARLAGAAALTVGGVVAVSSTAYAATPSSVTSSSYTVGSGAVTAFTVTPGSSYVVSFKATNGVGVGSTPGTVSVSLPGTTITNGSSSAPAFATTSGGSAVSALVSVNGGEVGFAKLKSTSGVSQAMLTLPTVVNSGDTVQIEFVGVSNPPESSATLESGSIYTSQDPLPVSAAYTIPKNTTTFGASASSLAVGKGGVTYNVGPIVVPSGTYSSGFPGSSANPIVLTFTPKTATEVAPTLPGATADYSVSVTNSSGATSTDVVTKVVATNPTTSGATTPGATATASLVLTTPLASDDIVNVTMIGVINPTAAGSVTVGDSIDSSNKAPITFGNQIGSLTASLLPSTTPNANTAIVNLVTSFVATDAIAKGGTTNIVVPSSLTIPAASTTVAVTVGSGSSAATFNEPITLGTSASGQQEATITMPAVTAGQQVAITVFGVTVTGTSGATSDYPISVYTSSDSAPVSATATEDFTVTPNAIPVSLSSTTLLASSNYAISGLEGGSGRVGAAIPADTNTIATSSYSTSYGTGTNQWELELAFPAGTSLPTSVSNYSITDSTNSSGSGQVASVSVSASTSSSLEGASATPNLVYMNVSKSIAQGDVFSVSVDGAINPGTASNTDTIAITGNVEAAQVTVAPATTIPTADMTYPNGALIQSGGQIDVVAGGRAFGIPNPTVFGKIRAMDMSSVV